MSVALKKLEGIASVNVTLKRGVAHITLKEGNVVSLPRLRRVVKDAGYTTGDADVTVRGDLARRGDELVLDVRGTGTVLRVAADPSAPEVFEKLRQSTGGSSVRVELFGKVPAAPADARQEDRLQVRSFTIDP